ncbi:P12 [Urbanus proteus nucleopolyhedrovirus]|uniref:P12 n=1 Tax=Urbanus proteus nucleopolyhedrovirus TaxID=1675866 RepID=A0A162GUX9_9ABAC|nr:P12 [Urbanus proteus nucleopolyhedrovirus]AKR17378.1 P12 [Urbanus proteus nucleopolyhedrovirus]
MNSNFISTANDISAIENNLLQKLTMKKRKRNNKNDEFYSEEVDAVNLIQDMNRTDSIAKVIVYDTDKQKKAAFFLMSKTSAAAKSIYNELNNENESITFDANATINVLKLLSDVYDNNFPILVE